MGWDRGECFFYYEAFFLFLIFSCASFLAPYLNTFLTSHNLTFTFTVPPSAILFFSSLLISSRLFLYLSFLFSCLLLSTLPHYSLSLHLFSFLFFSLASHSSLQITIGARWNVRQSQFTRIDFPATQTQTR